MAQTPKEVKDFDFASGDLERYLATVTGFNLIYRNEMIRILKSEENEMPRLREVFDEIVRRQEQTGDILMTSAFYAGFVTLYNMNVKRENFIPAK